VRHPLALAALLAALAATPANAQQPAPAPPNALGIPIPGPPPSPAPPRSALEPAPARDPARDASRWFEERQIERHGDLDDLDRYRREVWAEERQLERARTIERNATEAELGRPVIDLSGIDRVRDAQRLERRLHEIERDMREDRLKHGQPTR
jgi:hypothetical protein